MTKYMTERNGHQIGILGIKFDQNRQPQKHIHMKKKKEA